MYQTDFSCKKATIFTDAQVSDVMTTSHGHPIDDKLNSMTVGERGPIPIQDFTFLDEMAHFDRERIPERVVHAKGAGMDYCVQQSPAPIFIDQSIYCTLMHAEQQLTEQCLYTGPKTVGNALPHIGLSKS